MGSNGNFQRTKIQPIIDVPLVLQLESVSGEEATSKFNGLEYRYYVTCDEQPSIIYLNESGRDAIINLRPQPGDFIELLKQKRHGEFVYSAQLLSDAAEEEAQEPEPPRASRLLAPGPQSQRYNNAPRPVAHQHSANRRQAPSRPSNGGYQERNAAPPPRPAANEVSPGAQQLAGCLRISFEAWEELKAYALQKGVELDYTSEDVRATALTWFIQHARGRQ